MTSRSPFGCFDRRYFLTAIAALIVIFVLARFAHRFEHGSAPRIGIAVVQGLVMAAVIAYTVLSIRTLDELRQRIQLEAIAVAFTATGSAGVLYAFLVSAGVPALEWAIWVWPFMALIWGVSVLIIDRRYR